MNDKQSLIEELKNSQQKIVDLVETLSDDQRSIPYHVGVNPPLWEIGHAAFFFELFILKALDNADMYDPSMDPIWDSFNIDHEDRWTPGMIPDKETTLKYVDATYKTILARIEDNELTQDDLYLYKYSIFHQNMHLESLIWSRQTMGWQKMEFDPQHSIDVPEDTAAQPLGDAEIPAGRYLIGMPEVSDNFATTDFAFDNEKPGFEVDVDAFKISKTLVSNAEFMAFIEDGGYEQKELWSWGGKKWLGTEQDFGIPPNAQMALPRHPAYWRQQDGQWQERYFDHWKALNPEYPAIHINFYEAEAYCNWADRRLPTEYEWEVAALGNQKGQAHRKFPWGDTMDARKVDMDGIHIAHVPVTAYAEGESQFGCRQMVGTTWEWTSSQYLPYDGFKIDMYPFMSTLQFGYHKVTKGGSCATSSILIRGSYRQAYTPERTDVFVGFRTCAK
jgi:iron(II)-dependent oxidoreductase